ncbi:hypothetical protein Lalb_Chr17g0336311 [Lupinus albus]|uniref:Uncharacterized protein n=1 Tax=Lupinus albus TaxID=3870 RepID=A0A6A4P1B6_LUPAL|nr:hypothetical protein Lalb_Chr17g0336311 [Lupinus albus]
MLLHCIVLKLQDTSEFEDSASFYSWSEPDSHGSFEEECEPSPVSVLDVAFREDISSSSECLKVVRDGGYDSPEVDDEGFDLNVSSDVDCGDKSVGDFKEKQGLFRAEESRDISYVVAVLTEVEAHMSVMPRTPQPAFSWLVLNPVTIQPQPQVISEMPTLIFINYCFV